MKKTIEELKEMSIKNRFIELFNQLCDSVDEMIKDAEKEAEKSDECNSQSEYMFSQGVIFAFKNIKKLYKDVIEDITKMTFEDEKEK